MMDELVKKNINYIYNILIEIQDYMQSIYNPNVVLLARTYRGG